MHLYCLVGMNDRLATRRASGSLDPSIAAMPAARHRASGNAAWLSALRGGRACRPHLSKPRRRSERKGLSEPGAVSRLKHRLKALPACPLPWRRHGDHSPGRKQAASLSATACCPGLGQGNIGTVSTLRRMRACRRRRSSTTPDGDAGASGETPRGGDQAGVLDTLFLNETNGLASRQFCE